ncbi:tetratricopeptide repeat protein [Methylomicrobium sp. Wu6]|uniref:tetratricopeptide repeat protein n=1 Tax=Methylomicrobium sp. Wu6 TaxID=3107928 RepID=UPI002DD690C9|nr:tetratricopeptide repeat protein [Methylomicrobium sp. Wu6]MEC4748115.1 tetratricopeptide repeat protein [Methylomicrobium sp. Wu6]
MSRRKTQKTAKTVPKAPVLTLKASHGAPTGQKRRIAFILTSALIAAVIGGRIYFMTPRYESAPAIINIESASPSAAYDYVGADACIGCHKAEVEAWTASHHALAMQEANSRTVLADFENAKFKHFGVESTFFKRDGKYMVRTDGPDGKLADYEIKYTFGVTPLQQYLIEFPGGRYQALGIAWDSRPQSEGGQRWFHLYQDQKIDHNDQLHWTGRYQNWNLQCAECHSTHLKKGYDAAMDSYQTTFSVLNVSCESCHGPASQHVAWAKRAQPPYAHDDDKGLAVRPQSRWREAWKFPDSAVKFARRDRPAADALMNTCWACHARRSTLAEGGLAGLPLEDTHRPALLTQPTYYADGQQRDEDYTWGSFRQSKMYQKGVTCLDCHEPHTLKLRAEGNALCLRCHNPAEFDTGKHHFHKPGSKGAQCIDCHAPEQNYMVIDGRHDHSFRLPRPDLSTELGTPNACTMCHQNRRPEWAASALDKWYGKSWRQRPHYGTVLHAGAVQGVKALPALLELAQDSASPAVVRATAAMLAGPLMRPEYITAARLLLKDADPSVRIAALGLVEAFDPGNRLQAAAPLLSDPIRGVRIEAARILADVPDSEFPANQLGVRESAIKEYQNDLSVNADWPSETVNQGNFLLRQGRLDAAIAAYERAIRLDPLFVGAYVNLADAYRQQGREGEGEKQLRRGLALLPNAADLHHALGLVLVRQGKSSAARFELMTAAKLAPDNGRYTYVYAVALHSAGKRREALAVLKAADGRRPYDLDILSALISMLREAGDAKSALVYARKAVEVLPDDPDIKQLVDELEGEKQAAVNSSIKRVK